MRKNFVIIFALIIFLGTSMRFYKLGETSFNSDEFLDINSSYAYAKTGVWQNWDFNFGQVNEENAFSPRDERAWIYKWQVAKLFKILPPTESIARSVSVFWGIISIISIFFVAKYFTKKYEIGLLSAFLFAVSVSGIIFDRRLRMYAMFFAVFLLFSWLVFRFLEEAYVGKNKFLKFIWEKFELNLVYFVPSLILGIISILTHQLTANIIFIFIFYAIFQIILKIKNKQSQINKYSISLVAIIAGYIIGMFVFPDKIREYTAGLEFFKNHYNYFGHVFSDYSNAILAIIFLALGIFFLYKKQSLKKETLWLAISFIGTLLLAVFAWDRNVGSQYIFFVQSFEIILLASGIYFSAIFLEENMVNRKKVFLATIVLAVVLLPNYAYFFQDSNTYNQTSESDDPDYGKIFAYFKKKKIDGDVLVSRNFRNYYWSGTKTKVFDFGGELSKEKLSLNEVKKITSENSSGWFIFSDNDETYIANDAVIYIEKNLEKISSDQLRGKIKVYRWGNQ